MNAFDNFYKGFWIRMSESEAARDFLMRLPAAKRMKSRFIAGDTLGDGIRAVADLNDYRADGHAYSISGILDYVGERVTSREEAERARDTYCEIVGAINRNGLDSRIAVKLSQLGMGIGLDFCRDNIGTVAEQAKFYGVGVEIDAEVHRKYDVTLALQSARKASYRDACALKEMGANVRLVKSAYRESPDVVWESKRDVDDNYRALMATLSSGATSGKLIVATHDDSMIELMRRMIGSGSVDPANVEIDMLLGVRTGRVKELARRGYRTGVYVPYGDQWWAYFCRRIGERPANLWFVLSNMLG